jgi:hypothetical protein
MKNNVDVAVEDGALQKSAASLNIFESRLGTFPSADVGRILSQYFVHKEDEGSNQLELGAKRLKTVNGSGIDLLVVG